MLGRHLHMQKRSSVLICWGGLVFHSGSSVLTEVSAAPALGLPHCCVNNVVDTATFDNVFRLLCVPSLYVLCTHCLLVCVSSSFYQWNISRHHISFLYYFLLRMCIMVEGLEKCCVSLLEPHRSFEKWCEGRKLTVPWKAAMRHWTPGRTQRSASCYQSD